VARRGISKLVLQGESGGANLVLAETSAVTCDQIMSVPVNQLHEPCGFLLESQEIALHDAIQAAFDLV
jgi:mRNA-degrading endonuclease toxin of MazEF toxin-antitoxin module